MSALLLLRAVAAARLLAAAHALGVEGTADDLVADTRQVAHPAAAHQHDRVFLQVVPDAGDVRGDLDLAGEPDPGDLAERRVRLLGRGGVDARADPAALGAALERGGRGLGYLVLAALTDQLLDGGHRVSVFDVVFRPTGTSFDAPDVLVFRPLRPPGSGVSLSPRCTGPGWDRMFREGWSCTRRPFANPGLPAGSRPTSARVPASRARRLRVPNGSCDGQNKPRSCRIPRCGGRFALPRTGGISGCTCRSRTLPAGSTRPKAARTRSPGPPRSWPRDRPMTGRPRSAPPGSCGSAASRYRPGSASR